MNVICLLISTKEGWHHQAKNSPGYMHAPERCRSSPGKWERRCWTGRPGDRCPCIAHRNARKTSSPGNHRTGHHNGPSDGGMSSARAAHGLGHPPAPGAHRISCMLIVCGSGIFLLLSSLRATNKLERRRLNDDRTLIYIYMLTVYMLIYIYMLTMHIHVIYIVGMAIIHKFTCKC
jgi:hypothetical protein